MTKKILTAFVSVCFALITLILPVACTNSEINTPNILTDLYISGAFSKNDIKNIAALRVGYVAVVDSEDQKVEDYRRLDYEPEVPAPLSEEQKIQIENDFKTEYGVEIYDFEITYFYGSYNDRYVVEVSYQIEGAENTLSVEKIIVGNIFLGYIGLPYQIYVW